ncbi:MAG TPA: HAD family hydrolase [Ruminococcus sp.]|nr:HAD family hydrolase [Ruminococcus sp.]HCR73593.1 HAD family hydrolase [Ruminococcus sp.]
MKELDYPFDSEYILKKRRSIKKQLLADGSQRIKKNIAVLGGSTTNDIISMLELFLLNYGIEPSFYQSEFGQYWQDAMFGNPELDGFKPDFIFIHTTNRNITEFNEGCMTASAAETDEALERQYSHFSRMWDNLFEKFHCPIIQNNMELPFYRLLGNKDSSDIHGKSNFISRLNMKFYEYAQTHENFFIHDINYLSASYGLEKWSQPFYWYMYKYALSVSAIPEFSYNLANIIKSILGKNKKAFALDLDNTLWGGVIGDDGQEGIEIGNETSMSQAYSEFQKYIKAHKNLGVILSVCSKNDEENAVLGLKHPDSILSPDDFISIKANWNTKDSNISEIASDINILTDSIVFIDDNPAEREIVKSQLPGVLAPDIKNVESYIQIIDKAGYFEVTSFSEDDIKRNEMYKKNAERAVQQKQFSNYNDYLKSLEMVAVIDDFDPIYLQRIVQLTNKSNQFNLTTKRYTQAEMEEVFHSDNYIRLYGKLTDKFGDNGVVSVVIGKKENSSLHIDLWLMSCRVLKRDMEFAMLDELVKECLKNNISEIFGYYYKTAKNNMVKDLFASFGFEKINAAENGDSVWKLNTADYTPSNHVIKVIKNNLT